MADPALDFSFAPVANPAPRFLTPAQIAFYNREGYVGPLDVFSPA